MKKILLGVLAMFTVLTLAGSIAFGALFIIKNNEAQTLGNDKKTLQDKVTSQESDIQKLNLDLIKAKDSSSCKETTCEQVFQESGFGGITVKYPTSWEGQLQTTVSTDFVYEPTNGKVISKYDLILTKSSSKLTFSRVLVATGFMPDGLKSSTHDYVEVTPKVLRYSEKGENDWRYVEKLNCGDYADSEVIDLTGFDECYLTIFPGFGSENGAAFVKLKSSDMTIISEADEIVKSALN